MPPNALLDSLQAVRRKVKRLSITFGVGLAVAAAVGLLLLVLLIDYAMGLDKGPRLLLILAALGTFGYVVYHWIILPARAPLGVGSLAGRLERSFPQFDDRLRSTVDFMQGEIPGSEVMKQRVVTETSELAKEINFEAALFRKPVYFSLSGGIAALGLMTFLAVLGGQHGMLGIAFNRLAMGNEQWPKSVEIAMLGDLPARVAAGQRVPVRIKLAKGDRDSRQAIIHYRYDNGPWQREIMTRQDGQYVAALDARLEQGKPAAKLEVKLEAGDDEKDLSPIAVVPRLELTHASADITPPAYVRNAMATSVNLVERPATAAVGSQIALKLQFNKSLDKSKPIEIRPVKDGLKSPAITWDHSAAGVAIARFQAAESFRFTVKATDTDGFQNPAGEEYELMVREDQPPTVQIEEPKRSDERTPNAAFDIKAVAEDDYGIVGAQLVVHRLNDAGKQSTAKNQWLIDLVHDGQPVVSNTAIAWDLTDNNPERKRYLLTYNWQLEQLEGANLKPGDVLEYFIQVKDNFDLNGKQHDWVPSGKLRITIISPDQWAAAVQNQLEQVQQAINATRLEQLRQKTETDTLKEGLDRSKKFDEADKAQASRLANDQSGTASQAMNIADKLQQLLQKMTENKSPESGAKQVAQEVKKQLQQTADGPMREANKDLNSAKDQPQDPKASAPQQQKDAAQRSQAMSQASKQQQQAAEQLQQAMDKLGQMGGLSEAIRKLEKIREDQEKLENGFRDANKNNIGKKSDELGKDDQDRNKKMSDEQRKQANDLQQALKDMEKKADQMNKSDPSASQAMKQAAQMGQQQGLPSKQQSAADAMQQNQQAQAQQNQKQVELGLDLILNRLKEAERRRLEELAKQLATMQQLVAELITRQAGHNIDDLLLQGGQKRLEQVDSKERDDLIDLSGRDLKNMPPVPALGQLTASQEQTERNARDVGKQAEALPDPAPSAKIIQAAGHMERAIVHLRNSKLPDAYDPPQVEALRALVDAKKQIDEALKQANQQLEKQDAETLKQAYVKLLEKQKKVGGEITEIDKTPKDKDSGDLPREVAIKLGQLPGDQGKLIDDANKIGEKLKQLDSVVYDWANKDIIKSMGAVKDNLAKPDTGTPTQLAEKHVEDQIQAMIDSLVQKIEKKQFNSRNGGGQSGQSGQSKPKLPTEAELRLLKKNQVAINQGTTETDKAGNKDKERTLDLGVRQGDLRNLLDQLVQKASQGKEKLGPEPDNRDQLPEEATKEDVDDQELTKNLLGDQPSDNAAENKLKLTGDRMARSRQRLALNDDPGKVTQEIQRRITIDLDDLIKAAQQQQARMQSKPGQQKDRQKMAQAKPDPGSQQQANQQRQHQENGTNAAKDSSLTQGNEPKADLSQDIREKLSEWGGITQRDRKAVEQTAGEQPIGKYKNLVDDYYRSLAEQASKH